MTDDPTEISLEGMRAWVAGRISRDQSEVREDSDLDRDLGIYGDGHGALMETFAKEFQVDLSGYRWYFHTREQRHSFGSAFFEPPDEQVSHIPVTPRLLWECARKGKWEPGYPSHELPGKRWGLVVNMGIILFFLVYISWQCMR
jgi:hypothetical protein